GGTQGRIALPPQRRAPAHRSVAPAGRALLSIATVMKTAEMAVALHRLTGIPASRAGLYCKAPSGTIADFPGAAAAA
ncbi:MAG TPA: hypothetical protein VH184_13535, partial [Dongiaceae bacterium]|nr:hypothetical protein [Dongiaceae bacterium]